MKDSELLELREVYGDIDWTAVAKQAVAAYQHRTQQESVSGKETDMKYLFKVYVVDPKTDEILVDGASVIAKSGETARFKVLNELERDPDELIVHSLDPLFHIPRLDDGE